MTRPTNARIAGVTYFVYLAAGISMTLAAGQAEAVGALAMVTSFSALVLGVTLYAITRDVDPDLAILALFAMVYWVWRVRVRKRLRGFVGVSAPLATALEKS